MKLAYFIVLDDVVRAGLQIRAEICSAEWLPNLEAEYSRDEKVIRLRRERSRLMDPSHTFDREALHSEAANAGREACLIARELGYHHLALDGREQSMRRGLADTEDGRRKLLANEVSAWLWARSRLDESRFPKMEMFEELAKEKLGEFSDRLSLR